jgi:hypothetical protein
VPEVDSSKFGPCNVMLCERSLGAGAVATVAGTAGCFEFGLFPGAIVGLECGVVDESACVRREVALSEVRGGYKR